MKDILDTRFEGKNVKIDDNRVKLGDEINLMARAPAINKIVIGAGWDPNAFDADFVDVDISAFLLGKDGKTRVDEDFVFYNQPAALGGAATHQGDSRTGAGQGDDEAVLIDLKGIPFDVFKIVFVLSLYKGEEKAQNLGQVRNVYIRVIDGADGRELLRFELDAHMREGAQTAMIVGSLNREGPKWHFLPMAEFVPGGLGAIAARYGITITQQ